MWYLKQWIKVIQALLYGRLYDEWFFFRGNEIHLRIRPKTLIEDEKKISRLIDEEKYDEARQAINLALDKWNYDIDIGRLDTILRFEIQPLKE